MYEKLYTFSSMYKKFEKIDEDYATMMPQDERVSDRLEMTDMGLANQAFYLRRWGGYPVYQNTDVEFFHEMDKLVRDMEANLQTAQKFVFLECHACEDSVVWKGLMEILRERAEAGVEVRILYDGTGSKKRKHEKFIGWMKKKGFQCKVFHPRRRGLSLNYCDYRKTLIIDGRYAYTGDYEFTNDQIGKDEERKSWFIAGTRLTGDAVRSLTLSFLKMWNVQEENPEDPVPYLLKTAYRAADAAYVIPFATDPMKEELLSKHALLNLIRNAKQYLYLTFPENIRERDIKMELIAAAKRGVRVYLIFPEGRNRSEHKPSWEVTGMIRIFHYTAGRLKARMAVCDDQVAMVGNAHSNVCDIRHRYENGCWFSLCRTVLQAKRVYEALLPFCRERI